MRCCLFAFLAVVSTLPAAADSSQPVQHAQAQSDAERYVIDKFSKPEPDPLVEAARDVILARNLARFCDQRIIDQVVLSSFLDRSGLSHLDAERKREVLDDAGMRFDYLDVDTLHLLCGHIDQFFGPDGKLVKGLLKSAGKPE